MEGVFISDIQLIFSVLKFPFNSFLKTSFFSTKKCFPSFQVHLLLPHGSVLKSLSNRCSFKGLILMHELISVDGLFPLKLVAFSVFWFCFVCQMILHYILGIVTIIFWRLNNVSPPKSIYFVIVLASS